MFAVAYCVVLPCRPLFVHFLIRHNCNVDIQPCQVFEYQTGIKKKVAYTTSSTATGTEGAVGWIKLVCLVTYTQDPLDNLRPSDRSIYGFMVPRPLFFG